MIEIQWHPSRRELRTFAALLILFSGIMATILWYRTHSPFISLSILAIGTLLGASGCLWPTSIRWFYLSWMVATFPIGWTVSHLILAVVYFLVLTPIAAVLRLSGHDPMKRRWDRSLSSYWERRTVERPPKDYFRQF